MKFPINLDFFADTPVLTRTKDEIILNDVSIKIVRTSRKGSMALTIKNHHVRVLVPKRISYKAIETFIVDKTDWIRSSLNHQIDHNPLQDPHLFVGGEIFFYLGIERTLKLVTGEYKKIELTENSLIIYSQKALSVTSIKNQLKKWFQSQAQLYLAKRTKYFATLMVLKPKLINTRYYSARWGCCSTKKEITFNWQIIMAPEHIIDYVIVHELCHIKEHNHSPAYWANVEFVISDYKQRKKWLDANGYLFQF